MDVKRLDLVLLAALSQFCAIIAWAEDHAVFTSVFAALGTVAALGGCRPKAPTLTWMRKRRTRLRSSPSLVWASY
jgi:hypothetical protein